VLRTTSTQTKRLEQVYVPMSQKSPAAPVADSQVIIDPSVLGTDPVGVVEDGRWSVAFADVLAVQAAMHTASMTRPAAFHWLTGRRAVTVS
jgi:hypothetical protein